MDYIDRDVGAIGVDGNIGKQKKSKNQIMKEEFKVDVKEDKLFADKNKKTPA
jgi:hypothetical protein